MRIVVTIQHPAHVHFYRHAIDELEGQGHEVFVFARENDLAVPLLEAYDIPHEVLVGQPGSLAGLAYVQLRYEYELLKRARRLDPDVMTAIGGVAVAHVAPLVGAKSVVFLDNEGAQSHRLVSPFADVIATPAHFRDDFGSAHHRYESFQELAYLHPDRFEPDADRLRAQGIEPSTPYYVLRFRTWDALHDVGESGLTAAGKRTLVSMLADRGDVYISSSDPLPDAFTQYALPVPVTDIHDLLYYANGYAGDSATMATEAALLGTPAVRIQSFATSPEVDMSNFVRLESDFGLLRSTADEDRAVAMVDELSGDDGATERWRNRREAALEELRDGTDVICELLTGRPKSRQKLTVPTAE